MLSLPVSSCTVPLPQTCCVRRREPSARTECRLTNVELLVTGGEGGKRFVRFIDQNARGRAVGHEDAGKRSAARSYPDKQRGTV